MSSRAEQAPLLAHQRHVTVANGAEEHDSSVADGGCREPRYSVSHRRASGPPSLAERQLFFLLNIARAVRARLRIMDSKETRGTSMSLRSSAPRSRRCVALGMRAAARLKLPEEAVRIPAIAR